MKKIVALLLLPGLLFLNRTSWSIELSEISDRASLTYAVPTLLLLGAVVLALTELTTLRPMNDDYYRRPQVVGSDVNHEATYGQGDIGSRRSHATFVAGGSHQADVAGRLDNLVHPTRVISSAISPSCVATNVG